MSQYAPGTAHMRDADLAFSVAQAGPNNTNADSTNKIDLGGPNPIYSGRPVMVDITMPTHTVTSAKVVIISVLECATESGSYTEVCAFNWAAGEAFPAKKMIGLINPKRWLKINYSTTDNLAGVTFTAYLTQFA